MDRKDCIFEFKPLPRKPLNLASSSRRYFIGWIMLKVTYQNEEKNCREARVMILMIRSFPLNNMSNKYPIHRQNLSRKDSFSGNFPPSVVKNKKKRSKKLTQSVYRKPYTPSVSKCKIFQHFFFHPYLNMFQCKVHMNLY